MEVRTRSVEELVKRVLVEPGMLEKVKTDPVAELQKLATQIVKDMPSPRVKDTDVWIYRAVVGSLGFAVIAAVIGAVILSAMKITPMPETLTALGSAAVGALAGLLAPSPAK